MTARAWFAVEVAAIAAIAIAPVPVPAAWLLGVASVSMWARDRTWSTRRLAPPEMVPLAIVAGLAALALSLALSAPLGALTGRAVEWTQDAVVRGSISGAVAVAIVVAAQVVALELALRGWLVPRVLELAPRAGPALAVLASAAAEAAITRGHAATRAGGFALGLGGALFYLGAGRRLAAPLACRLAFELGAVALTALRVVG